MTHDDEAQGTDLTRVDFHDSAVLVTVSVAGYALNTAEVEVRDRPGMPGT